MITRLSLLLPLMLLMLVGGCSDPNTKATGTTTPPAKPAEPQESLLEALLKRRTKKEGIFVADCSQEKFSETPALRKICAELTERKIKFKQPLWPKYTYYLNRLIPILRQKGKIWLIYNHNLPKLTALLKSEFLDRQVIEFTHSTPEGTLALVTNKFTEDKTSAYKLESLTQRGGGTSNIVFTPDGSIMFFTSVTGIMRWASTKNKSKGQVMAMPRAKKDQAGVFTGGESGLIGMALHPDFDSNQRVFLHYIWQHTDNTRKAIVSEWHADLSQLPKKISFTNERKVLELDQPYDTHNAGALAFGPDGYLYIAVGDGHVGNLRKRAPADSMRGKVLRIDVDKQDEGKQYAIPSDNPYVNDKGFPPETWAWGFRNPWRIAFTPDGRMVAGDIGEDINEELTFVVRGKHHGWPFVEGSHKRFPWKLDAELQPSLLPYDRTDGMSVIGGHVYTGEALPELKGRYIFADYLSGSIWAIDLPSDEATTLSIADADLLLHRGLMVMTISPDPSGELYFGAHTGEVYRLERASGKPATLETDTPSTPADAAMARGMFGSDFTTTPANKPTQAQAALGARLFRDAAVSANGKSSCATCHPLDNYGQDGKSHTSQTVSTARNTPSVFNVGRQFAQFRDYRALTVEDAVLDSLSSHMGHATGEAASAKLQSLPGYKEAVAAAFPGNSVLTAAQAAQAIGAYLRQLNTSSRWEKYLDGDDKALTTPELIGLNEFIMAGCTTCHQYRGLGGGMLQKLGMFQPWTGADKGRGAMQPGTGQDYYFKTSSLFNVAKTAPYYHDGSVKTLGEAVRNMAQLQLNRKLSDAQVAAIVTFLGSLTGEAPKAASK